jgi:hypothetical protein
MQHCVRVSGCGVLPSPVPHPGEETRALQPSSSRAAVPQRDLRRPCWAVSPHRDTRMVEDRGSLHAISGSHYETHLLKREHPRLSPLRTIQSGETPSEAGLHAFSRPRWPFTASLSTPKRRYRAPARGRLSTQYDRNAKMLPIGLQTCGDGLPGATSDNNHSVACCPAGRDAYGLLLLSSHDTLALLWKTSTYALPCDPESPPDPQPVSATLHAHRVLCRPRHPRTALSLALRPSLWDLRGGPAAREAPGTARVLWMDSALA